MKKQHNIFLALMILSVTSCNQITQKRLDVSQLEKLQVHSFTLAESGSQNLQFKIDDKAYLVNNIVFNGINPDGIHYYFLSTDDNTKQILLVIDQTRNIYKWTDFYVETSHLFTKNMVAFVIKPFPERHIEEEITVTDFKNSKTVSDIESFRRNFGNDNLQELYYLTPIFNQTEEKYELNMYWEQAHYPMVKMRYSLDGLRVGFSSNDNGYTINELIQAGPSTEIPLSTKLDNRKVVCSVKVGDAAISIAVNPADSKEWSDYTIITDNGSGKIKETGLSSLFRYQDPLISIKPAIPVDERAAFIITTSEFVYDFYFDPKTGTSDAFLRPSSFTTRYPH